MKKFLLIPIVLCGLLAFGSPAWSVTMAEVGNVDDFLNSALLSDSGTATELAWVNSYLGTSYTEDDLFKDDDFTDNPWTLVEGQSDIYASEFQIDPAYFYIKIGTGALPKDTHDHYLYENEENLSYGVIDWSDIMPEFPEGANIEIWNVGRISHTGELGGEPVPEPATMMLLGSGLIGLAGFGRRKFFKKG